MECLNFETLGKYIATFLILGFKLKNSRNFRGGKVDFPL
jgi:hypothetical protein